MGKREEYRAKLKALAEWDDYLRHESGLPGPRGNLELAQAVADEGERSRFECYLRYGPDTAPVNDPGEFLAFCGVVGMGRLAAEGDRDALARIRASASDPRWRMREGVAMALQRVGDANMDLLIREMRGWAKGSLLERRAAAAALCEPRLLRRPEHARAVLAIVDAITRTLRQEKDRAAEGFLVLRKGLGYCWSVAVAAEPEEGKALMEAWLDDPDKDIRWIMRENLKKNRLERIDARWVEKARVRVEAR